MPFVAPSWARKFTEADLKLRPHAHPDIDTGLEYGYWWVEWGGCLDTIKDAEAIRDELLAIVMGIWDHIKNTGNHGAEHWALEWFGFVPGKRESRRFVGQHILHEADLLESREFDDAIAFGGWPIDIHPPEGIDAHNQPPCTQHHLPYLFDIPLRSCVARDVTNLMFAGRNISATHVAFASTRVMATCAAVGQGVGTAAAHAAKQGASPADLAGDDGAVHAIQQRLLRDGCYLIGRSSQDDSDLARRATVTASSQQEHGPASAVIDGHTRSTHGDRGVKPGRERPLTHRWMSDPAADLPAWLELAWPSPIRPSRIEITFDTGLHRVLTLSQSDAYAAKMQWGRPQAETVRDYTLELLSAGNVVATQAMAGNYQRRRVHVSDWPVCDRLRVTVSATNGLDHARIVEVRVYEA
jgi:hypothetical protein